MPKWANDWELPKMLSIRCVYHTRLIIKKEISGASQDYAFDPGESREIEAKDAHLLLAMRSNQYSGCCGGTIGLPHNYFE